MEGSKSGTKKAVLLGNVLELNTRDLSVFLCVKERVVSIQPPVPASVFSFRNKNLTPEEMQSPTITIPIFKHPEVQTVYELTVGRCIPYHGPLLRGPGWDADKVTSYLIKSLWHFVSQTFILILRISTTAICIWVIISYLARLQFSDITFFKFPVLCMKL